MFVPGCANGNPCMRLPRRLAEDYFWCAYAMKFFEKFAVCPFELVLRYVSLKGPRLWNMQEKVSHRLSLIVSYSYISRLSSSEKETVKRAFDKILRVVMNTVVRCVSKRSSESSCIWSIKVRRTNVLDSQQFLQSALLPSEQLETGNKNRDVIAEDWSRGSATKANEHHTRKEKKFFTFSLKIFPALNSCEHYWYRKNSSEKKLQKVDRGFTEKFLSEKWVAVIGQDEVQCEFPIPSWRSSSTEHGQNQRPEVSTTKRFEWRQHVLTSNVNCPCSDKLQHLCRHLLLCSTDEWSGLRRNRNLHKTQLNLGLNPAPEALWPRVQINHCALGSLYISLLKIHDCWSQFLCLMSKRTHTHTHTHESVQWKDLSDIIVSAALISTSFIIIVKDIRLIRKTYARVCACVRARTRKEVFLFKYASRCIGI